MNFWTPHCPGYACALETPGSSIRPVFAEFWPRTGFHPTHDVTDHISRPPLKIHVSFPGEHPEPLPFFSFFKGKNKHTFTEGAT